MKEYIKETRFDNGLVVLTDRMHGVRSATLGFFYRTGARHEPAELTGITHFIEHAVFKGTSKRTALDIAIEQDRLGGALDAFTTHEETGFVIKVIDDQLENAFDLIGDMLTDPVFSETDLEAEQRVIIEEMKMIEDSPEDYLGELFSTEFYPGHPLGMPIPGTPESVKTFDKETTAKYHRENFHSGNLVIAAAGNVEHERILALASAVLTTPQAAWQAGMLAAPVAAAPIVIKQRTDLEQAHLIIATPFVAAPDKRRYAADLIENILGGGTSSRLWQKIREERGLAYSVGASAVMYQDVGMFSVFAGTSPEHTSEVVDLTIAELREVVKNGVTETELSLAKQTTRASILMDLEDSASRAGTLAQCEMVHGRQIPVEETLANIDAVTIEDCHALAAEFFRTEDIAFAAIGDIGPETITRENLVL